MPADHTSPIVQTIAKLLRLANRNPNEHEAAAALAKALDLLKTHQLKQAEVEAVAMNEGGEALVFNAAEYTPRHLIVQASIPAWKRALADAVAVACGCKGIRATKGANSVRDYAPEHFNQKQVFWLLGRLQDVQVARAVFGELLKCVDALAAEYVRSGNFYGSPRTAGRDYRCSYARGVRVQADAMRDARDGQASSSALIVLDRDKDFLKQARYAFFGRLTNIKASGYNHHQGAYAQGQRASLGPNNVQGGGARTRRLN